MGPEGAAGAKERRRNGDRESDQEDDGTVAVEERLPCVRGGIERCIEVGRRGELRKQRVEQDDGGDGRVRSGRDDGVMPR